MLYTNPKKKINELGGKKKEDIHNREYFDQQKHIDKGICNLVKKSFWAGKEFLMPPTHLL